MHVLLFSADEYIIYICIIHITHLRLIPIFSNNMSPHETIHPSGSRESALRGQCLCLLLHLAAVLLQIPRMIPYFEYYVHLGSMYDTRIQNSYNDII
jgi:hypothetical protein